MFRQLRLPYGQHVRVALVLAQQFVPLPQRLAVLLQGAQIGRVQLGQLHVEEEAAVRRSAFDQGNVFRRKKDHTHPAEDVAEPGLRQSVHLEPLRPFPPVRLNADWISAGGGIRCYVKFVAAMLRQFRVRGGTVAACGGGIERRFQHGGLALGVGAVYDVDTRARLEDNVLKPAKAAAM